MTRHQILVLGWSGMFCRSHTGSPLGVLSQKTCPWNPKGRWCSQMMSQERNTGQVLISQPKNHARLHCYNRDTITHLAWTVIPIFIYSIHNLDRLSLSYSKLSYWIPSTITIQSLLTQICNEPILLSPLKVCRTFPGRFGAGATS